MVLGPFKYLSLALVGLHQNFAVELPLHYFSLASRVEIIVGVKRVQGQLWGRLLAEFF